MDEQVNHEILNSIGGMAWTLRHLGFFGDKRSIADSSRFLRSLYYYWNEK